MKKLLLAVAASVLIATTAAAQVLPAQQMKNTAWAGFGAPLGKDAMFHGFTDTFQARFDRGNFTIEGMLNWSFLANYDNDGDVDNFVFGTSNRNPLSLKYGNNGGNTVTVPGYSNHVNYSNTTQDSYYVNFVWHPTKNVDFGVGTKLNWQVGPAPRYGSWLWESDAHVRQGGFSTSYDDRAGVRAATSAESVGSYKFSPDKPGSADVVGFVPYANKYAKRALGVRYIAMDKNGTGFQIGAAIPNGFNTDDPAVNLGFQFAPAKNVSIAAALEGALDDAANFYAGTTLGIDNLILDLYVAADRLFTEEKNDQAYGLGGAITFIIPDTKIKARPEMGLNLFENENYTFAWYAGGSLDFAINKSVGFNLWGSFAVGSSDERWDDASATDDWDGGHIFDIRPQITYEYSKNTTFAFYVDFEQRTAFDGKSRKCWSSGVFMTYIF